MEYYRTEENLFRQVNENFAMCAPYWGDSIYQIKGLYQYSSFDIKKYKEGNDLKIMDEEGSFFISTGLFHPENYREFIRRKDESTLLSYDEYDLSLADSLWIDYLKREGLEVDAVVELNVKKLREMFPAPNEYVADAPSKRLPNRKLPIPGAWTTDTVGIGICNQGLLIGHVHIPVSLVIQHMNYTGWGKILLLLLLVFSFLYGYYKDKFLFLMGRNVKFVGLSAMDMVTNKLFFWNGDVKELKENRLLLMRMLLNAPDYRLAREEICATFWPNRILSESTLVYNSLINNLRVDLKPDGHLKLKTERGESVQLVEKELTEKERFMRRKHFFFLFLFRQHS